MGLDIDPIAARQASHVSGCEVREGTLASTEFPDEYFQSIYMRHVFEHLPNPRPSLLKCFDWLAPGGRLVLEYPNPESLGAKRQRDQWLHWDPPRHLVLPSCGAVIPLLQSVGFAETSITTFASSAAETRKTARNFLSGADPHRGGLTLFDRFFQALESTLVLLGNRCGEEIHVIAIKR